MMMSGHGGAVIADLAAIPSNLYKPNAPWEAEVLEVKRLTADHSDNDVKHVVLSLKGSQYRYLEGQSVGILPPGIDEKTGKAHKLRLYSIASPSVGDDGNGETVTVCVKRLVYQNESGETIQGVCSSFICDLEVGQKVMVTGPVGKAFLPPQHANPNMIMVATGTGIAPFRAFMHWRYVQHPQQTGKTMLFFGVQKQADMLYEDELQAYATQNPGTCQVITARSREEKTSEGNRMYVQHRIAEHANSVLDLLLEDNTYFYICGLRGMEPGIFEALEQAAQAKGLSWESILVGLQQSGRWMVEVY
jgi:ferredoxin--NADP+ reductase